MKSSILRFFMACLLIIGATSPVFSQGPGKGVDREDIESMKIAFLTRRLNLTPDEARKFWPVYNQFSEELKVIRENRNKAAKDTKDNFETLSDKEVEKIVDGEITFRQQEIDLLKKYHNQFKQTLPIKKVAKLYRAEEDFKKELLERIKERRAQRAGQGR